MQLCQIHFYQKIGRKKVVRVNVAEDILFRNRHSFFIPRQYNEEYTGMNISVERQGIAN